MTPADRPALLALVNDVLGFYGQATSPFALGVWWEACKGLELDAVRAAMTAYATDPDRGHFAPKPADVIRIVQGSSTERAAMAWTNLLDQVRSVGSYGRPNLDAATRQGLEAIGGWAALCQSDESRLTFLQRQFAEGYVLGETTEQRLALAAVPKSGDRLAPSVRDAVARAIAVVAK